MEKEQLDKVIQDIRKELQLLYCKWCPKDCQDFTEEEKLGCLPTGGFVDDAFPLLISKGVEVVDKDAELPENKKPDPGDREDVVAFGSYNSAQIDMKKVGFKKTYPLKEDGGKP